MTQPQFHPSFCPDLTGAPLFVTGCGNVVCAKEKRRIEAECERYEASKLESANPRRTAEMLREVRDGI
jgi:hypothetical protein